MGLIGLTSADLALMGFTVALVVSLNVVAGPSRHLVFCQTAFFGVGAYTVAILSIEHHLSFWPAMLGATLIAAAAGFLVGLPVLRVSGLYFVMITYAVGFVAEDVAFNASFTGAGQGLGPMPVPTVFGSQLVSSAGFALAAWLVVLAAEVVLVLFIRSRAGWAVRAVGAGSKIAAVVGAGQWYMLLAFMVSAALAGLAGGVFAYYIIQVYATSFTPALSLAVAVALLVGGLGSVAGSAVSAIIVSYAEVRLLGFPYTAQLIFGLFLVAVMYFQPGGLLPPRRERALARWVTARLVRRRAAGKLQPSGAAEAVRGPGPASKHSSPLRVTAPPAPDGESLLSVRDVRKAFGGVRALDGVSFDLARGECLGVIGPNGAGKTTLLDVISGFTVPDRGRVRAGGVDLLGLPARGRAGAGIGRTFQTPTLLWQESVFDNVALGGLSWSPRRRAGRGPGGAAVGTRKMVTEILVTLGLDAHSRSYAADLSYGQQKITEIGRALAASPRFLLLDEPLAGLHPDEHGRMIGILRRITGLNVGVVLIEHNLGVVARTCDRVLVMHHGAMVADGPVEDVYRSATVRQAYFGPPTVGGR